MKYWVLASIICCFCPFAAAAEPNRPTADAVLHLLYTDQVDEAQAALGLSPFSGKPLILRAE